MKKLLLGLLVALPLSLATEASALPLHVQSPYLSDSVINPDLIEVKGGRGGGGWGRGHAGRSFGWSRGRKVGWRGRGCPPGLWKQGRC
jgi:hypothetical protein